MEHEEENLWLKSKMGREDIIKAIPKEAMESLCREYDIEEGEFPEHDYEGCALYTYFCWTKEVVEEKEVSRRERNETYKAMHTL